MGVNIGCIKSVAPWVRLNAHGGRRVQLLLGNRVRAWADRHSTALIVSATVILVLLLALVLLVGLGEGEGEGGAARSPLSPHPDRCCCAGAPLADVPEAAGAASSAASKLGRHVGERLGAHLHDVRAQAPDRVPVGVVCGPCAYRTSCTHRWPRRRWSPTPGRARGRGPRVVRTAAGPSPAARRARQPAGERGTGLARQHRGYVRRLAATAIFIGAIAWRSDRCRCRWPRSCSASSPR